jgi:cold shock protein
MRTLLVAAASALFFAALVTELSARLWPGSHLALFVLAAVTLLVAGLLNARLARRGAPTAMPAATPAPRAKSRERERPRREARPRESAPPAAAAGPREQGTVKWFNRSKGFGFIIRESGDEIFVHQRSIRAIGEGADRRRPMLHDGQAVSFVVAMREKGLQAEDVVPADGD